MSLQQPIPFAKCKHPVWTTEPTGSAVHEYHAYKYRSQTGIYTGSLPPRRHQTKSPHTTLMKEHPLRTQFMEQLINNKADKASWLPINRLWLSSTLACLPKRCSTKVCSHIGNNRKCKFVQIVYCASAGIKLVHEASTHTGLSGILLQRV